MKKPDSTKDPTLWCQACLRKKRWGGMFLVQVFAGREIRKCDRCGVVISFRKPHLQIEKKETRP